MGRARWLWLLLPFAGLAELALAVRDARSAPRIEEWQALRAQIQDLKRPSDLLVVAPEWADPLARYAFGDALMPIADLARPDVSGYARAVEVDALGESAPELEGWRVREERRTGRFTLRVRENPQHAPSLASLLDRARPPLLQVDSLAGDAESEACHFTERARLTAGGLHGHLAFPRERYQCRGGEEHFVGISLLDDQDYRPRRCLFADPRPGESLRLSFKQVPIGRKLSGYAGLSYFIFRDGRHGPVTLTARVGAETVGRYVHEDATGWHGFSFDTSRFAGESRDIELTISSADPYERHFCFYAATK